MDGRERIVCKKSGSAGYSGWTCWTVLQKVYRWAFRFIAHANGNRFRLLWSGSLLVAPFISSNFDWFWATVVTITPTSTASWLRYTLNNVQCLVSRAYVRTLYMFSGVFLQFIFCSRVCLPLLPIVRQCREVPITILLFTSASCNRFRGLSK